MFESPNSGLKITALSVPDVARVLSKTGGRAVSETTVRADIDTGAPTNPDGTMNIIQYAAWLVRQEAVHGD